MAGYDLSKDRLYGHVTKRKSRVEFLAFVRYLRSLYSAEVRIAIVLDNFSPHLSTKAADTRVGDWAAANNEELAYVPFYGSCSIGSRLSSPCCATSPWTAPTTTTTPSKPA